MWELNKLFTIYFELLGFKFHTLHSFKKIETFQFEKSVIFLKKKKCIFFLQKIGYF